MSPAFAYHIRWRLPVRLLAPSLGAPTRERSVLRRSWRSLRGERHEQGCPSVQITSHQSSSPTIGTPIYFLACCMAGTSPTYKCGLGKFEPHNA